MIKYKCDICKTSIISKITKDSPYELKLKRFEYMRDIYLLYYTDICPECAKKIRIYINELEKEALSE